MRKQYIIGTATDCLANISPIGKGVATVGTTYFHLLQGALVSLGLTTAQPVVNPTLTLPEQTITHITSAASEGNAYF